MALSRVTVWNSLDVLTASALNGEFNNILNNAVSLISPLTAALDFNAKLLTNLAVGSVSGPGLSFNSDSDTGLYSSATNTVDVSAGSVRALSLITTVSGVNYIEIGPAATGAAPNIKAQGSDTNITLNLHAKGSGIVAIASANTPFQPGVLSGNPVVNCLYRGNLVKAAVSLSGTGTPAINQQFNVASITDNGVGDWTITFTTELSDLPTIVLTGSDGLYAEHVTRSTTSSRMRTRDAAGVLTDSSYVGLVAV